MFLFYQRVVLILFDIKTRIVPPNGGTIRVFLCGGVDDAVS